MGNDFGFTVVPDTFSTDVLLTGNGPLAVAPGDEIVINYTIDSPGPGLVTDGILEITLPLNAALVSSTPAGTVASGVLTVSLPSLGAPDSTDVELRLTAPGTTEVVDVGATVSSTTPDGNLFNNSYQNLVAVLPGGAVTLDGAGLNAGGDHFEFSFETVNGVIYLIQSSLDLQAWADETYVFGDGMPHDGSFVVDEDREFFRVALVPQDGNVGGGGGE